MMPTPSDDFCDRLWGVNRPSGFVCGSKERIFTQTVGIVRRRRQVRRLGYGVLLVACYLAGVLSMKGWSIDPAQKSPELASIEQASPKSIEVASTPKEEPPAPASGLEDDPQAPALIYERVAEGNPDRRAFYYRLAGDRYLAQEGNMVAALRCYQRALESASEQELTVRVEDNWLLMALKNARVTEKRDVQIDG